MWSEGTITFGCFNNWAKVSLETLTLWSEILRAIPNSRLLLKSKPYEDNSVRNTVLSSCEKQKIDPSRLVLEGKSPREQLLATYQRVDIALDPMPFGGGTTTAESLWMGVPVVTMRGQRWVGRVSESILHAIGLPELVAKDREGYRDLALELAQDASRILQLRSSLRDMLVSSPLCDGRQFTQDLESAYRGMWQKWCEDRGQGTRV